MYTELKDVRRCRSIGSFVVLLLTILIGLTLILTLLNPTSCENSKVDHAVFCFVVDESQITFVSITLMFLILLDVWMILFASDNCRCCCGEHTILHLPNSGFETAGQGFV